MARSAPIQRVNGYESVFPFSDRSCGAIDRADTLVRPRVSSNGKTAASQAANVGSIPITRSIPAQLARPNSPMQSAEPLIVGWREWLTLPSLGIGAIKAKLDTGARTSSLCVVAPETFESDGRLHVSFLVYARRRSTRAIRCTAPVVDRRPVTDSGGHTTVRWFIRAEVVLGDQRFETDINLTDRRVMLFPLLLGRGALGGRFRVDPVLSYTTPKPVSSRPPYENRHPVP